MTWKDINIQQYIQLYNLKNVEDEFELLIKQIAIIKGLTVNEVENLHFTELNNIKNEFEFLANEPNQMDLKQEIELDGEHYFLKKNFLDFTLGEWIDLEAFNKDFINNMHRILAVLYIKKDHKGYNPAVCDEIAEVFLNKMDIETALSAFFFFYLFGTNYIQSDMPNFSLFQVIQMRMEQIKEDQKKGLSIV